MPSSSHALGVRRQVFSGWVDGRSAAVLGYSEEAAEENPDAHMDKVRSQMADAARKTGQLEASVQEVAKQVEGASGRLGGLADALDEINGKIRPVGVLNVKTNCLHVAGPFSGSPGSWKTVCGWGWVNAGKGCRTTDGRVLPVCQSCVVHVLEDRI